MLTNRQKLILKAIIDQYSQDGVPVGSKAIVDLPYLKFSPATIRAEMSELEEYGYLEKTHTSSGRVPSKLGYKYYVENLITRDQEITSMFPLIDEIFESNRYSRTNAVNQALELLTKLTNYTALAIGPDTDESKIKKIDFIPTTKHEAILLIVTDRGHVQHQSIQLDTSTSLSELKEVISTLDDLLKNQYLKDAMNIIASEYSISQIDQFMSYQATLVDSFINAFSKFAADNYYLAGLNNVFGQPEFNNVTQIKNLMELLDKRQIAKLVGNADTIQIKFGSEVSMFPVDNMTMITIPFETKNDQKGQIALLGPSRMAYAKIIPLLEYVSANIAKLYNEEEEE